MALDNYADLQASIASWLNRDDLAANIPDFIGLVEAKMNRTLATSFQLTRLSLTIDAELVARPAGMRWIRSLRLTSGTGAEVLPWTPEEMAQAKAVSSPLSGQPTRFTLVGTQFEFWPAPDQSYAALLECQAGFAPLSNTNPTNWILTDHPDAYLYGALAEGSAFVRRDDRVEGFLTQFETALAEIQRALRTSYDRKLRVDPGARIERRGRLFNIMNGF